MHTPYRALQLVMTLLTTGASLNAGDYVRTSTKEANSAAARCHTSQEIRDSISRARSLFEHMRREYGSKPEHLERINQEQKRCMSSYYEIEPNHSESYKQLKYLSYRIG